ncbi:MAG: type IV pilus secretin PilQ [Acidobacteria bacterium]|nr:type IV pilus secretin PilQ [Acidobacteriota bacterium]
MNCTKRVLLTLLSILWMATAGRAANELLGLRTTVDPEATTFLLRLPARIPYTPAKIGSGLFVVDLVGISGQSMTDSQPVQSPIVSSYRLLNYEGADNKPHLALEISLQGESQAKVVEVPEGLEVRIEKTGQTEPPMEQMAKAEPVAKAPAVASPISSQAPISLREVAVMQPENGPGLEIEIVGDGIMEYRTLELRNPDRLVVDIPNAINRIRQKQLEVNTSPLKTVRIAQYSQRPLMSRVVMDLDFKIPYQVQSHADRLLISLGGNSGRQTSQAREQPVELEKPILSEPKKTTEIAKPPAEPAEPILMASNQPSDGISAAAVGTSFSLPSRTSAVQSETSPLEMASVPELPAPLASNRETLPLPEVSPAVVEPAKTDIVAAQQDADQTEPGTPRQSEEVLLAAAAPPPMPAQVTPTPQTQFTGEPISLDLKDVDLDDFFRLIHEISGLNIVVDPNVSGTVTIVLNDVPWDQALDIVLRNNGLEAVTLGNVVRIAKVSTLEAEARAQLAKAQAEAQRAEQGQPTDTVTRTLSYAKAPDLVPTLKRFLSPRGEVVPDARTNMLIITDIPVNIARIDGLIGTLDQKSQQVEIEARIVAASRSFARDIGVQLAASGASGNVVLGGTGLVGTSSINRGTAPPLFIGTPPTPPTPQFDPNGNPIPNSTPPRFANLPQPLATNFPAVAPTSGMSLVLTGGANFALDAIITAAESKGLGKLLSRPKVITQNNVEATVKQGVRIPIQTSINNTISVQFVDVVLRLTVTPQITAEGTIFLKTDVENTTIDPGIARIQGVPALDTQQATTQVLVSNGGTVFFGGVIQTINNLTEVQTPLLGSIPIIGNLFKRKATSSSTNELLFFITPKLVQS